MLRAKKNNEKELLQVLVEKHPFLAAIINLADDYQFDQYRKAIDGLK
jgi:hypothetical protein